jgi:hypothetical protein
MDDENVRNESAEARKASEARRADEAQAAPAPRRRARFPYARVALASVGVLLSSWLWVGESWRFDVTPRELLEGSPGWGWKGGWAGRYVRLPHEPSHRIVDRVSESTITGVYCATFSPARGNTRVWTRAPMWVLLEEDAAQGFSGRVDHSTVAGEPAVVVDTTRGRWTGKSVVALLIGLWGVGIAASSVWVWQKRRKLTTEITESTEDD